MNPVAQDLVGGETLVLSCKVSGSVQVDVTWQKDGVDILFEDPVYSQQETFEEGVTTSTLTGSDAGTGPCLISIS